MSVPKFSSGSETERQYADSIIRGAINKINSSFSNAKKNAKAMDRDGKEAESWKFVASSYSKLLNSGRLSDASYVVSKSSKLNADAMGALATSYKQQLGGKSPGAARDERERHRR